MRTIFVLFFLIIFVLPTASAGIDAPAQQSCEALLQITKQKFMNDPRFHWVGGFFAPFVHRLPPNLFSSQMAVLARPYVHELPTGMTPEEHAFFNGVFSLLRDRERVYVLLKELEQKVQNLSESTGVSPETALDRIFSTYEKRYGFKAIELHDVLTKEQLMSVIEKGEVFTDVIDNSPVLGIPGPDGTTCQAENCRWAHGRVSHRLQMYLVLRDLEEHPDRYGHPKNILKLYQQLGSQNFNDRLNWSKTGLANNSATGFLFAELFDSHENNPSSPGFFTEYHEYWPGLPL